MRFDTTSKLLGHESQILSILCGNPKLIKFLEYVIEDEQAKYDCPADYRELIFLSSLLCDAVAKDNVCLIENTRNIIMTQFHSSVIGHQQIRCLLKLIHVILAERPDESDTGNELIMLRNELLKVTIPKLSFFCVEAIRSSILDESVLTALPQDIQQLISGKKH